MKKDYLILVVFLAVIVVSGGLIYMFGSSGTDASSPAPASISPDMNRELKARITRLEGMLASDPNNPDLLIELGNAYFDIDEPQKSIEYYEKSLLIRPDNPPVLVDCGIMYRTLGQADKAIEMIRRAIKVNPDFAQAYFNLGVILRMEKDDRVGAAEAWKKFLELEPHVDPQLKKMLEDDINNASTDQG